jgi:hypothetical protein
MDREVQRLRDSAQTAQKLNGDYGVIGKLKELTVSFRAAIA